MKQIVLAALATWCGVSLHGQSTRIVPEVYAGEPGDSWAAVPFSTGNPARCLHVYDASIVPTPALAVLNRIALRVHWASWSPAKGPVDVEVHASTTTRSPLYLTADFAANHGPSVTAICRRRPVQLPAGGFVRPTPPPPFALAFALDVPFPYVKAWGNLALDYRIHAQPNGTCELDAAVSSGGWHASYGTPCGPMHANVSGGAAGPPGARLDWQATGAPPLGTALLVLGPFALGTPLPLPHSSCVLRVDMRVALQQPVTAAGTALFRLPLAVEHRGLVVHGQLLAVDPLRTALTATTAARAHVGLAALPLGTLWSEGSATASHGVVVLATPVLEVRF